jgi:hypothetical protein
LGSQVGQIEQRLRGDQKTVRAIAHWAMLHAREIIKVLQLAGQRIPSASTLYRALRYVDVEQLEHQIAEHGQAIDEMESPA